MPSEKSNNQEQDAWGYKAKPKSRVDSIHGGTVVEEIETPVLINNPACTHEWEIDPTETEFVAYMCIKPDCGEVKLFDL